MKLVAILVETRAILDINKIICDHMDKLPMGTPLHIFTSTKNLALLNDFPETSVHTLNEPFHLSEYNRLMTSVAFWNIFQSYDRVLIFQTDSGILRKGIEEFYEWDYVGAPWTWNTIYGGNGGLSLRNPKVMLEIATRYPWNGHLNEDHWFCMHMHDFKIGKMAPISVGRKFSVEAIFQLGTFGYHAIDKYMERDEQMRIYNQYNLEEQF